MNISPLAPDDYPVLSPVRGVRLATGAAAIRYQNRTDMLLVELARDTAVAGVLTTSLTASAPVLRCRQALAGGRARVLVVNSGNSNAFTGRAGEASVNAVQEAACQGFGCTPSEFYMASTGVIGEKLPHERIVSVLPSLRQALKETSWMEAARAIMTTDTYPKLATRQVELDGKVVVINGIAKGSGMIAPDMATMLAFVFTDAAIAPSALQTLLTQASAKSFNCISVDGDTSTSDTLLLFATGKAGNALIQDAQDERLATFRQALESLMMELALHVVKDGEGAERLVEITVRGAEHDAAARRIGMSIANSPLVKTALAAGDANWGRIVMAVGKAGEKADRDALCIHIGGVAVATRGEVDPRYHESQIAEHMRGRHIEIMVDVGVGGAEATVWTCDLTHRYIDINGSYRS